MPRPAAVPRIANAPARGLLFLLLLLALIAALAVAPPPFALAAERCAIAGNDVHIWNLAGETRIEPTTRDQQVIVLVERGGRDAGELKVVNSPIAGLPSLRVIYDAKRVVYPKMGRWSNSSVNIRKDGTWSGHGSDWFEQRVVVTGGGSGLEAHADLVVQVPRGRKVAVHTVVGAATIENVDGRLLYDGGSSPVSANHSRGELTVDVGSGAVEVHGFDGTLSLDTGSGSVTVMDVQGPRCHVDTGSGGVDGSGISVQHLDVDTGSGSVDLANVRADDVSVDTGSGSVDLQLATRAPHVEIDTGSGHVRMEVPEDFSAALDLETGSGGISTTMPITVTHKDSDSLVGRLGDGAGHVHVDTGSGGVTIAKAAGARSR